MSRSLALSYQSAAAKYSRLSKKIKKSISRGEFWRFTRKKRNYLVAKIEKLKRRLAELRLQMKIASAGIAAAAILGATSSAEAQLTPVGPFIANPVKNPLPPPAFSTLHYSEVQYHDFDGDGDLDAVVTGQNKILYYYTNVGNAETARFESDPHFIFDTNLPGPPYTDNPARATFADVDDDGDLDMLVTVFASTYGSDPDPVMYYENVGQEGGLPFFTTPGQNPFQDIAVDYDGWPKFADIDNDGDKDLVLSGYYYDNVNFGKAWIQYYKNEKVGHEPGVVASFSKVPQEENPLFLTDLNEDTNYVPIAFADLDEDGDDDFIYITNEAIFRYKRNDNGVFVEKEGAWEYNSANPGATTGNPFNLPGLNQLGAYDNYRSLSFADLDNDGDLDATMGINIAGKTPSSTPYVYFENTNHGSFTHTVNQIDVLSGVDVGDDATSQFFDYDNDGDLDIVTLSTTYVGSGCVDDQCETYNYFVVPTVFLNTDGKFEPQGISLNPLPSDIPTTGRVKMMDVDDDGDLDLVVSVKYEFGVPAHVLYYRNDNGTYASPEDSGNIFSILESNGAYKLSIAMADLDNDGLSDLIVGNYNNELQAYKKSISAKGEIVFEFKDTWSEGFSENNIPYDYDPSLSDLDSDGDYDLIIGKYEEIWYFENQGDATEPSFRLYRANYGESPEQNYGRNPFQDIFLPNSAVPTFADTDGDGDKDLLYGDGGGSFGFLENQNPSPDVNPGGNTTLQFVVGQSLPVAPNISIEDGDNDNIIKITLQLSPFDQGQESLNMVGTHGNLTALWNDEIGMLTISGNDTITVYQEALRAVEYVFNGASGGRRSNNSGAKTIQKTLTVTTLDADLTVGPDNTTVFSLNGDDGTIGAAPALAGVATPFYTSGATVINENITVTDTDGVITGATVVITSGLNAAQDELLFTDQNGITGVYSAQTGTLTLTGNATPAQYQDALRSVKYNNPFMFNATSPATTDDRAITFTVNDGTQETSLTGTVITINKAPVVTQLIKKAASGGNIAFTLSQILSDPDNNLDLGTLEITSQANAQVTISNEIVTVDYSSVPNFEGDDVLIIGVCDIGGRCTVQSFAVEVRADIYIYTGMSPNGDGINDWFHIDFLPEGTHVAIYNRWGDIVYEESAYDVNDADKRFEGKNKNGTDLVAGSYYYKVKYNDGGVKTGYILLNR